MLHTVCNKRYLIVIFDRYIFWVKGRETIILNSFKHQSLEMV